MTRRHHRKTGSASPTLLGLLVGAAVLVAVLDWAPPAAEATLLMEKVGLLPARNREAQPKGSHGGALDDSRPLVKKGAAKAKRLPRHVEPGKQKKRKGGKNNESGRQGKARKAGVSKLLERINKGAVDQGPNQEKRRKRFLGLPVCTRPYDSMNFGPDLSVCLKHDKKIGS